MVALNINPVSYLLLILIAELQNASRIDLINISVSNIMKFEETDDVKALSSEYLWDKIDDSCKLCKRYVITNNYSRLRKEKRHLLKRLNEQIVYVNGAKIGTKVLQN